eukprot:1004838_1
MDYFKPFIWKNPIINWCCFRNIQIIVIIISINIINSTKYFIISIINNVSSSYSKSIKYDGNIFYCPDKEAESNDGSDIKGIGDEWYTNLRLKKHLLGMDVICKFPSVVSSMVNRDPSKIPYIPDSTRNPYAPNPRESIQIFVLLYRNRVQWYNTIIFSHQSTPITSVNDGLPLQDYQRCPTTSQISSLSVYWSSKSEILCDFIPSNAFYMSSFDKLDYYLTNQLQQ